MVTVFGMPAVEVEQPAGDVVAYLVRVVAASRGEWGAGSGSS
jgi:hypothetical protein